MIFEIQPRSLETKQQVAYWEDFLTDDEINQILSRPEWSMAQAGMVGGSVSVLDPEVRSSNIAWMSKDESNAHIWQKISNVFSHVNSQFFGFDLRGFYEPMQLGLYTSTENGHYTWHIDGGGRSPSVPRKLSMALMLDDTSTFDGGNLCVKAESDDVQTLEQKRGRAWFFPSYVLHTVTPVTRGIRRSLVLWAGGPDFK